MAFISHQAFTAGFDYSCFSTWVFTQHTCLTGKRRKKSVSKKLEWSHHCTYSPPKCPYTGKWLAVGCFHGNMTFNNHVDEKWCGNNKKKKNAGNMNQLCWRFIEQVFLGGLYVKVTFVMVKKNFCTSER